MKAVTETDRWNHLFNGQWSASYFMSQDPVAIDSVGLDFLYAEFAEDLGFSGAKAYPAGAVHHSDNYLIEAANGTNRELGPYKPNGKAFGSLGTHEHWNNPSQKKYSRNLTAEDRPRYRAFPDPMKNPIAFVSHRARPGVRRSCRPRPNGEV